MTDVDRLVEVRGIAEGSGFLIADGLILTAWHLLRPPAGCASASTIQVRIQRDIGVGEPIINAEQSATILWPAEEDPGDDFDFALLAIKMPCEQQIQPVPWASLPKWGKLEVTAVGYPDATIDRKRSRRDSKGISGWIESADNIRSLLETQGTLTMRISDEDALPAPPATAWPGMSGAAVFADQMLIGIVSLVGKEGDRHQLRVLPIDRLFTRDDVAKALASSGHFLPRKTDLGRSRSAQASSWRWPRPWDFSGYIVEKRQGFTGRDWLFDEVRDWYDDKDCAQALLVCADFGFGKSAFLAALTTNPHGLQIAAHHFCDRYINATLNPVTFVAGVAAQLATSLPAYRSAVEADSDARRWLDDAQVDPASAFERAVIGPLHSMNPPAAHKVLLVDALDEALDFAVTSVSSSSNTIVRLLANQANHLPAWLRVLATTRRIQEVVQPVQKAFRWVKVLDGEDARNLDDITQYVAGRSAGGRLASVLDNGKKSAGEIAAFLSNAKQSGGKFLYAVRVLDDLESGKLPVDRLNDLPTSLDGFYLDAFERRFPGSDDFGPVGALLGVLSVEREPMSRAELAAILCTSEKTVGMLLKRLEDFLRISAKRYAFDHLSLAQWLSEENDDGFPRAGRFSVSVRAGEAQIAEWARKELAAGSAHESEYLARHLGAYLTQLERKLYFTKLLPDFRWLDARLRAAGINALLRDCTEVVQTPALKALERALRHSAHVLGHNGCDWSGADLLASQILGRTQPKVAPEIHNLCGKAAEAIAHSAGLRPLIDSLRSTDTLIRTLDNQDGWSSPIAVLADRRLASGSSCTINLWSLENGLCEATLAGHESNVNALAVLADGRLASASSDCTIRLWNLASGVCEAVLEGHTSDINALVVAPGGKLASGSSDYTIRIWDPASGACEGTLKGHFGLVLALAVLADGRLASGSWDGTIRLWNPASGGCDAILRGHDDSVHALAVLPDGRLASGSSDCIRLWNPGSRVCEATLKTLTNAVEALTVLADGRLASGSFDRTIRLWNTASAACEATLHGHAGPVFSLAALSDGLLVSGSGDGTIKVWNPESDGCSADLDGHADHISGLTGLADGRLASGSRDKKIKLWNPANGVCEATLEGHPDWIWAITLLPDGRLASGSDDSTIRLWNPATGACEATLEGHAVRVRALAAMADGRLASGAEDGTIRLWDPVSRACEAELEGHQQWVSALAVLFDGRLASASGDSTIKLWNTMRGVCEATLEGHKYAVFPLAVLPDGRLVSGSVDQTIRVWNPASRVCEATLNGHTATVMALTILPDGRIASGANDKTIRVWQNSGGRWTGAVRFVADANIVALTCPPHAGVLAAGDEGGHIHFLKVEAATTPK